MKIERYMFSTPAPWRIIVDSWGQTNYSRKLNISKYMIGGGFLLILEPVATMHVTLT